MQKRCCDFCGRDTTNKSGVCRDCYRSCELKAPQHLADELEDEFDPGDPERLLVIAAETYDRGSTDEG